MTDAIVRIGDAMRVFWECQKTARENGRVAPKPEGTALRELPVVPEKPLYRSPLGSRYDQASFETSRPTDCLQVARDFSSGCLVLSGPAGCGKTWAAACVVRRWQEADALGVRRPHVFGAAEIANSIKFSDDRLFHIKKLKFQPLLVLDDLGTESRSDLISSVLDDVINHRYSNNFPTVVTTNLSARDFRARYGERITDRLREWGTFFESRQKSMRVK